MEDDDSTPEVTAATASATTPNVPTKIGNFSADD